MSLKDTQLKNIKPSDKIQKLPDGGGLNLVVFPSGGKIWKLRYRWHGKEQTYTIGEYPRISLGEARKQREELKALIGNGVNPNQAKQEEQRQKAIEAQQQAMLANGENTFRFIADEWLEQYGKMVSKKQYTKNHGLLHNYIYPAIGHMDIKEVTAKALLQMAKEMEAKGLKTMPKIALRVINQIYGYAISTDRVENSPANNQLQKHLRPHIATHHPHIGIDELPKLLEAIERVRSRPMVLIALKLIILIHPRQGELRQCKWEYINWETNTLTIPSHLMKGKIHEKEAGVLEHVIPLPTQAVRLFEQLRGITGDNPSGLMFPNIKGDGKVMSDGTINKALRSAGYTSDKQDIHGFRGLASTYLNEKYPEYETPIEKMLGHKGSKDDVKLAYDHSKHLDLKRRLWQEWGDFLESQGMKI